MTTQEETHAVVVEETTPIEVTPLPSLEDAPPLLFTSEPTPFFESAPPTQILEAAPPTQPLENAPPPAPERPALPAPAPRVNAPDPFAVGVRLLRMAPAWLLFVTVFGGALVMTLGWVRGDGDASAVKLSRKQNDARAVQTGPKTDAPAPKTAAANSPEVAQPAAPAPVAAAPIEVPAAPPAQAAQPAPAPAEQPAPPAGAKFTVQVGSYTNQSEANGHVSRLRAAGFESRTATVELPGRGTWYRVQVGRFAERAEAAKAVSQLRAKGAADGAIVAPLQD